MKRLKNGFNYLNMYNRGLIDAQDIFKSRVDSITDAIYELEVPTEFSGK